MRYYVVLMLVVGSLVGVAGQDTAQIDFDVASVKPAMPNRPLREVIDATRRHSPGQFRSFDLTFYNLILNAYPQFGLPGLISGGPGWIKEARFDIEARMRPTATHAEVETMMRRLLQNRFALRTHIEQRTLDVFLLTVATPGKLGPGLTQASTPCVLWRMTGGPVPEQCNLYGRAGLPVSGGMTLPAATIADLITGWSLDGLFRPGQRLPIDRPIVDKTGLEGYFQIIGPSAMADPDGSFFTLVQEQLGLKLTRSREVVDVLVIDSASMPEPN